MNKPQIPWGRVTAEFFVIVAGVTVALLADDWRDYRNDRQDERVALQGVLQDLRRDSIELEGQLRNMRGDEEAATTLLRRIGEDLPNDSIWSMTRPLFMYVAYEQVSPSYSGLRDSGRLGIIQDTELRRDMVGYFEVTQPYLKHFYDQWWEALKRFTEANSPYLRVVPNPTGSGLRGNAESRYAAPWREIAQDHKFLFGVEQMGIVSSVFRDRVNSGLTENRELQRQIRETLQLGGDEAVR